MVRMRLVPCPIAICGLLALCVAGPVEDQKIDPLLDDWEVEAFHTRTAEQLERLAELMQRGETIPTGPAGILAADARSTALRPSDPNRYDVAGQVRVRRLEAPDSEPRLQRAETAIAKLVRPLSKRESGGPKSVVGASMPWSSTRPPLRST